MSAVWFEASDPPSSFPFELGCRVPYVEQVYCSHAYAGYLADHVRGCSWEKKFRPTTRVAVAWALSSNFSFLFVALLPSRIDHMRDLSIGIKDDRSHTFPIYTRQVNKQADRAAPAPPPQSPAPSRPSDILLLLLLLLLPSRTRHTLRSLPLSLPSRLRLPFLFPEHTHVGRESRGTRG